VEVITRNDYNFGEVVDNIVSTIATYSALDVKKQNAIRNKAGQLSEKALWKHFIEYYFEAYNIALSNRNKRIRK